MASYTPDIRYIASIYPAGSGSQIQLGQLPDVRRAYGPTRENDGPTAQRSTLFHLEPVPKRGADAFILPVYDSFELVLDVMQINPAIKEKPRAMRPVPCEQIVADLLAQWTGGMYHVPPGATPGIMEIHPSESMIKNAAKGTEKIKPSVDELREMVTRQTLYFQFFFNEAEKLSRGDKTASDLWKDITPVMRLASKWLGMERIWSDPEMLSQAEPCPWCQKLIPKAAIVCGECGRQVRATPAALADLEKLNQAHTAPGVRA